MKFAHDIIVISELNGQELLELLREKGISVEHIYAGVGDKHVFEIGVEEE